MKGKIILILACLFSILYLGCSEPKREYNLARIYFLQREYDDLVTEYDESTFSNSSQLEEINQIIGEDGLSVTSDDDFLIIEVIEGREVIFYMKWNDSDEDVDKCLLDKKGPLKDRFILTETDFLPDDRDDSDKGAFYKDTTYFIYSYTPQAEDNNKYIRFLPWEENMESPDKGHSSTEAYNEVYGENCFTMLVRVRQNNKPSITSVEYNNITYDVINNEIHITKPIAFGTESIIIHATDADGDNTYVKLDSEIEGVEIEDNIIYLNNLSSGVYTIPISVNDTFETTEQVLIHFETEASPVIEGITRKYGNDEQGYVEKNITADELAVLSDEKTYLRINASDYIGDTLQYSVDEAWIDRISWEDNETFSCIFTEEDDGRNIIVKVNDGTYETTREYSLNVRNNSIPEITAYKVVDVDEKIEISHSLEVNAGENVILSIEATDDDGDGITYEVDKFFSQDQDTKSLFSWEPEGSHVGNTNVTFTISDGFVNTTKTISIEVLEEIFENNPPVIEEIIALVEGHSEEIILYLNDDPDSIEFLSVIENRTVTFAVYASDIDNDTLTYDAITPNDVSFNVEDSQSPNVFNWISNDLVEDSLPQKEIDVTFTVTDGKIDSPVEHTIPIIILNVEDSIPTF